MHCMNCGTRIPLSGELYCDERCAAAAHRCRRASGALPERYRSTLRALLDDRPVSREETTGFYGWLTRRAAA
jgi:hypothetical protein